MAADLGREGTDFLDRVEAGASCR